MLKNQIFKPLNLFFVAANSLVATGLLTKATQDIGEWVFLLWGGVTGIFLTYRFNDFIDAHPNLEFNFKAFFKIKTHLFFTMQLIIILIPLSFIFISPFRISVLALSGFLGFLYSIKFKVGNIDLRLKNIFLVKNILIGLCWGSLVLVGADQFDKGPVIGLFLFTSVQVLIGSSLRDFTDIKQDSLEYVHSLPVTLGERNALLILCLLNLVSILLGYIYIKEIIWLTPVILTASWRQYLLYKVFLTSDKSFWCQKMNLLTCLVIFLGTFLVWIL